MKKWMTGTSGIFQKYHRAFQRGCSVLFCILLLHFCIPGEQTVETRADSWTRLYLDRETAVSFLADSAFSEEDDTFPCQGFYCIDQEENRLERITVFLAFRPDGTARLQNDFYYDRNTLVFITSSIREGENLATWKQMNFSSRTPWGWSWEYNVDCRAKSGCTVFEFILIPASPMECTPGNIDLCMREMRYVVSGWF